MSEPCTKEHELGQITAILERVSDEVYGNGQMGMVKIIPRLEEKINNLNTTITQTNTSIAAQTAVISNLVNFQTSLLGVNEYKAKKKLSSRQWTMIIISGIVGCATVITAIIFKLI